MRAAETQAVQARPDPFQAPPPRPSRPRPPARPGPPHHRCPGLSPRKSAVMQGWPCPLWPGTLCPSTYLMPSVFPQLGCPQGAGQSFTFNHTVRDSYGG